LVSLADGRVVVAKKRGEGRRRRGGVEGTVRHVFISSRVFQIDRSRYARVKICNGFVSPLFYRFFHRARSFSLSLGVSLTVNNTNNGRLQRFIIFR